MMSSDRSGDWEAGMHLSKNMDIHLSYKGSESDLLANMAAGVSGGFLPIACFLREAGVKVVN